MQLADKPFSVTWNLIRLICRWKITPLLPLPCYWEKIQCVLHKVCMHVVCWIIFTQNGNKWCWCLPVLCNLSCEYSVNTALHSLHCCHSGRYAYICRSVVLEHIMVGWFLFWWNLEFKFLHGFKLFHFVPRFQNSFCFCSTTIPSAVRKIFLELNILHSKNEPKICKIDKMAKNHFSRSDLGS